MFSRRPQPEPRDLGARHTPMESGRFVIIGAGGMARCVLDLVDVINAVEERWEVFGVAATPAPDDEARALLEARGVHYVGGANEALSAARLPSDVGYIIGIGDSNVRVKVDDYGQAMNRQSPILVHPNVHMGFDVQLGPGCVVASHVSMENHIRLGRHVHVNQNATIGHDTVLENCTTVSPLVAVSGNVTTEPGVFLGTGSAIREKVTIARHTIVGMGATVVSDITEPSSIYTGTPAKMTGKVAPRLFMSIGGAG